MSERKTERKVYSVEFKKETLSLVQEQGYSVKEAAEAVGIQPQLIYKWLKAFDSEQSSLCRWLIYQRVYETRCYSIHQILQP